MKKVWILVVCISLLALTLAAVGCETGLPAGSAPQINGGNFILSQQNTGIWVTGEGKVSVTPDVAMINLGVEAQANKVELARQQAEEAMTAIMAELESYGVAEEDIKTQRFSIYPVRRWEKDQEILIGYRVTNIVTVKIRELDDTGAIIDAVVSAGGDYTRVNSVSFTVDDPTEYYEEVREKAMEDAENKAEQLADLSGVSLGRPTYINEGSIYAPVTRDMYYAEAGAPAPEPTTPISPGETDIRLTVQVVYSIQ
ncbi:MAG TPA: SIMPL domain-containing protein [Dehalococcoidia bacterium]|nr:SIMPL domain-containing protein [Dehalococcoidia bacterium]